jgi:hypothetical protein
VDFFVVAVVLLADLCVAFFALIFASYALAVLKQPAYVAIRVGDGGHQAAAGDVAWGLLHGRIRRVTSASFASISDTSQKGHRRGHPLRPPPGTSPMCWPDTSKPTQ